MATAPIALPRSLAGTGLSRGKSLALLLFAATAVWIAFQGQWTLPYDDDTPLFRALNDVRDWLSANRLTLPVFVYVFDPIRQVIKALVDGFQMVFGGMSWIGITAVFTALGLAFVTWRTALLVLGSFVAFGLLGLWDATIQTLALISAAVTLSLLIGIPLGVLAGRSDRFMKVVSPVLDVMQIMPTFAYLAPLALFFLIGQATAAIATLIYAIPPAIRITALGIRGVSAQTVEAAESMGSTRLQVLFKVQIPMARTTIGLAINQTIMMALSMVVIAALVGAGGLGNAIISSITRLDVGRAFDAGLAIVLLAMVLDRLTAAASKETDRRATGRSRADRIPRRAMLGLAAALAAAGVIGGIVLPIGQAFPDSLTFSFADAVNSGTAWLEANGVGLTEAVKLGVTLALLNPLQTILTSAPWWLVVATAATTALIISGRRAAVYVVVCLVAIVGLQVWEHAMETTAQVIVAVLLTLAIGIATGVAAARSDRFSRIMRPINDAAQTMPSFVYILPAVALFGPTRFTAILAAIIYAFPAVIRLVEDGVRGVPATVIEAATSAGSSRLQMIFKVQLPMARSALLLAANQGVVLVLAMVVVGGLVGGGALGYDVVAGFAQGSKFGSGMAAAVTIVMLGIVLDRVTQGASGKRAGGGTT